ncbi:hypothetical protein POX_g09325 [Penicillium oxalicum]|uniref:Uncharacterized protein n=1 Tax=Penicillium oxalicum (strain 114-2 / CGMCC 5302) TaxID=933388 RepID=S7ZCF5_PENO1|nr:hypothetical protein POX_g09325 [Penicillium oxalicum]EPS26371.1 hypothetical protein PDE_01307 [Penicillium oxalicum 114-2]KAI2786928.1 hypothetical protein POX_g09325 [Penicillium oxalicum]
MAYSSRMATITRNVRSTQSSPFHPTCLSQGRLKKALRLIRNRENIVLRLVSKKTPDYYRRTRGKARQLQHPRIAVAAAWVDSKLKQGSSECGGATRGNRTVATSGSETDKCLDLGFGQ